MYKDTILIKSYIKMRLITSTSYKTATSLVQKFKVSFISPTLESETVERGKRWTRGSEGMWKSKQRLRHMRKHRSELNGHSSEPTLAARALNATRPVAQWRKPRFPTIPLETAAR